jgi:ankyrin repeat protein
MTEIPTPENIIPNEPLVDRFRRAVADADLQGLRRLLESDPAARDLLDQPIFSFDSPALVSVAGSGNLPLVDLLLEFGADPNGRSSWWAGGFHPLYSASGAVADRLLAAGSRMDACAAAHLDRPADLLRILDQEPDRVHERGGDGQTPLHFARSREVIDLLLGRGADIDARDIDHRGTAAEWMLDQKRGHGRNDLARYLVERGASADIFLVAALGLTDRLRELVEADPSLLALRVGRGPYGEQPPSSYHIYSWTIGDGLSPLQVAVRFGQDAAAALLSQYGTLTDRFLAACGRPDAREAERLLAASPGLVGQLSSQQMRELPDAGWAGNVDAVVLMLRLGFDPRARGQDGGTVIHCGAWQGAAPCVEAALRFPAVRALIEDRDPVHGSTPLGWCCHGAVHCRNPEGDYPAVAKLLIEAGAVIPPDLAELPLELTAVLRGG